MELPLELAETMYIGLVRASEGGLPFFCFWGCLASHAAFTEVALATGLRAYGVLRSTGLSVLQIPYRKTPISAFFFYKKLLLKLCARRIA